MMTEKEIADIDESIEATLRQDIDEGLRDSEAGKVVASGEVRTMFGLPE